MERQAAPAPRGAVSIAWESLFAVEPRAAEDPTWDRLARWAARPGTISFAGGVPDARLFPVRLLREHLDAALDEEGTPLLQYSASRGHPPFLEFLVRHLAGRGIPAEKRRLLVVSGSQQGLDLIGRTLIGSGDAVIVEDPTYSGALALFRLLGARLLSVPMTGEGLDLDRLASLLARERPKLIYTMPTFHNPTGQTLPTESRRRFLDVCAAAGVPIVEDDTDGELRFEGKELSPLAAMPGGENVLYLGTFSKLFFPGLRLGWVAGPPGVVDRLEAAKRVTDLHTPPLLQAAMARFAAGSESRRVAEQVRRRYGARRDALLAALETSMPDGVTWSRPEGGLSLMVSLPDGMDAGELLRRAAEEGVLFAPGRLFSPEGRCSSQMRLGFGGLEEGDITEGTARLARAVKQEMEGASRRAGDRETVTAPPLV